MDDVSGSSKSELCTDTRLKSIQQQLSDLMESHGSQEHDLEAIKSRLKSLEYKLSLESSARTYLQAYNQNLSEQNRELTIHLQSLVNNMRIDDGDDKLVSHKSLIGSGCVLLPKSCQNVQVKDCSFESLTNKKSCGKRAMESGEKDFIGLKRSNHLVQL
ncbi:hypothetical protein ACOME3_002763 [Neoechinorhynchus agilis]